MKKTFLLLMGFFCCLTVFAGEISEDQAMQKARQILKGKQLTMQTANRRATSNDKAYYVFNAEQNGGFVVIAANDLMPEVLGYAEQGHFDLSDAPDNVKWLFDYYAKVAQSLKNVPANSAAKRRAGSSRAELAPLMNTRWDQVGVYQGHCPEINGQKTLTGCVATAMAQVVNFFQWPLNNVREAVGYTVEKSGNEKVEMPSLPARQFNWFSMSNDDIAWLMRYCGQAVMMNYGLDESTAFSNTIPGALISVFNFSKGADEVSREEFTDGEWEQALYHEIELGRPVIYSGFSGQTGHTFVLHGYKNGQFYVNWGWGGRMDGYFALTNLKPAEGSDFSENQTAVVGIQPASNNDISYEEKTEIGYREVHLEKQGQLAALIPESERYRISRLKITGEIGGKDIDVIRDMSENKYGNGEQGRLSKLDLSEARIVGGETFAGGRIAETDVLDGTFHGCITLTSVILPKTLKTIRSYVFSNTNISSIVIPKSVTEILSAALQVETLNSIQVEEGNEVYYSQNNALYEKETGVLVRGCRASGIPEGVVEIGARAFAGAGLESIDLPKSLKIIGEEAFAYNNEADDLFIPAGLQEIGDDAFFGCNFQSITVDPENPVYDSRNNCNAIIETVTNKMMQASEQVSIPATVTSIASHAFSRLTMSRLEIPQTVTQMEYNSLSEIRAVTFKVSYPTPPVFEEDKGPFGMIESNARLIVPDGTKALYAKAKYWDLFTEADRTIVEDTEYAQNRRKTITVETAGGLEAKITSDIKKILEEVKVEGPLNGRDISCLRGLCKQFGVLRSVDLSDATIVEGEGTVANELPEEAFRSTFVLEHLTLPKTLVAIGSHAFSDSGIRGLVLPKTVKSLGNDLFYYARNLETLSVEAGNPVFDSRNNCNAIIETATNTLRVGCATTVIPASVVAIGKSAFSGKPNLTEVAFPNGLTTIGDAAFWADINLTGVRLSESVTHIGSSPFVGCSRITSFEIDPKNPKYDSRNNCNAIIETATGKLIQGFSTTKIPDDVKIIATEAFRSLATLTEIEIPASVEKIEANAFLYCNQMTKVVSHIRKPFAVSSMVFNGDNMKTAQLYVPYGTREAYANTPGWDNFTRIIEMEPVEGGCNKNGLSVGSVGFGKAYAALGGQVQVPVTVTGEGLDPVTSIDYTITTGSNVTDYHLDLETPINFMMTSEILITLDADATLGEHNKTFKLTKVNGVDNECTTENVKATGKLVTVAKKPKVCPVVEEATGTWCGWCSRGIPSLALINKVYKGDVITIAVHGGGSGDPMTLDNYVLNTSSYPSCSVNRSTFVDPYFGSSGAAFGIQREIEAARRDYVPAGIEVEAVWANEAQQTIKVKTTTTFVENVTNANYAIGYVLVANGLKGNTPEWYQSNYYAGSSVKDEVLEPLTKSESKMTDVVYNHVPVAAYEPFTGIAGSVPASITKDVAMKHEYSIDITGNTRIQDKEKLSVVALLIDKTDGTIVNAAQFKFYQDDESGETSIGTIHTVQSSDAASEAWYDLQGRRLPAAPTRKGLYLNNGKTIVVP